MNTEATRLASPTSTDAVALYLYVQRYATSIELGAWLYPSALRVSQGSAGRRALGHLSRAGLARRVPPMFPGQPPYWQLTDQGVQYAATWFARRYGILTQRFDAYPAPRSIAHLEHQSAIATVFASLRLVYEADDILRAAADPEALPCRVGVVRPDMLVHFYYRWAVEVDRATESIKGAWAAKCRRYAEALSLEEPSPRGTVVLVAGGPGVTPERLQEMGAVMQRAVGAERKVFVSPAKDAGRVMAMADSGGEYWQIESFLVMFDHRLQHEGWRRQRVEECWTWRKGERILLAGWPGVPSSLERVREAYRVLRKQEPDAAFGVGALPWGPPDADAFGQPVTALGPIISAGDPDGVWEAAQSWATRHMQTVVRHRRK